MFPIRDTIPSQHPPIATVLLIIANCLVFIFELRMPPPVRDHFFQLFGIVPARLSHPEWALWFGFPVDNYWPLLTSMFLHAGWLHIIGNMWALWIFGDNVEDRMGPVRFVVFYLLCGLIAAVVHWLTNPHSAIPTVGASGAIAGVMGAYLILFPRSRVIVMVPVLIFPFFFELPAVFYLVFWAFMQVFSGTLSLADARSVGGVAWWAHAGGFSAGIALHSFFIRRNRSGRAISRFGRMIVNACSCPHRPWR